ncbi:MAG TPA: NAD-glutamate dehydrogenase [Devosiaceae bacterium]|jgi:glutamate dehydrogenase
MLEVVSPAQTRAALLARAGELDAQAPAFAHFLAAIVMATDPQDFEGQDAQALETMWREAFDRLGSRGDQPHLVTITPPVALGGDTPQIVEVYSRDMPFIVDSVLAAIRAHAGQVRLITHPVVPLDGGRRMESFLQVHIDPVGDAAATDALKAEIEATLADVSAAVADWQPMLARIDRAIAELKAPAVGLPAAVTGETTQFLAWLKEHNFTFLGLRDYRLDAGGELVPEAAGGLGILRDPQTQFLRSGPNYVEMTPQHRAFLAAPEPMLVTKANIRARVHRRSHMDYIGIKRYDAAGAVMGETRILGLFTSLSLATPHSEVPLVRRKLAEVMRRSGYDPQGHAGKALMSALESYPRDELFQIDTDQLAEFAQDIANLADRPRIRVLPRIDPFDNFVSVLLYLPRDRYDSDIRAEIGARLAEIYEGRISAYYPHFLEADLVRVHFIIGRNGGVTPRPSRETLEAEFAEMARSFGDRLVAEAEQPALVAAYRDAFSPAYQSHNTPVEALADIAVFNALADETHIAVRLGARTVHDGALGLKVYHRHSPIPLSDRVPMLEHFGFRVIDERTYTVTARDGAERYLHDMVLATADGARVDLALQAPSIEAALLAVWDGLAENDGFNALTLKANLAWDDVALLRALARYLRQIGFGYSQTYLARVLATQPDAATRFVDLFHALHDPRLAGDRDALATTARAGIAAALDATTSLDEERILERFQNLIEASVRTNAYQRDAEGNRRPALAIKFDCKAIEGLPEPRPFREIFVYAPRVEGLHLRFGAIARGGIRWSDRPEDFRTEILGLVKAQQVKNAVIVPVGAKGGFVPKRMPAGADRDVVQAEGTACYKIFIGTLLDVTDNLDGDAVIPPANVLRRDGDDPYLVVAADKGTASFSDIANAIALNRGYWLGDAFASGGSAGYDHKEIGITARGAWESVKRHFGELDRDVETEPFTVVGVGDMSGDVFGNGMLLSRTTRLIAAFDHRDIFIDPDPDPAVGFAERQRLFELPRSSWQDYDQKLLSPGGGIYSRRAKSIALSDQARAALDLTAASLTPNEVMTAILKARVDVLWFGGIGTYVRGSTETDADAGDRANDAIRITGADLRATVVAEGANLAMTQRGRIDYALRGGRLNTDAIDNSAGVNSSDLEVNIKIALGSLTRAGILDYEGRNTFLRGMTDEVAALCLRNNYLQTLALSLTERRGMAEFPDHRALIQALEAAGQLNRAVEFLPDEAALDTRALAGKPLTRPELAVLLAYAKLTLYADLLASAVPDDDYLGRELFRYFPETLHRQYPDAVTTHRLRREVIATVLANAMINRGGPAFVNQMTAATSADPGAVAFAYAAARDAYGLPDLNAAIDTLDGRMEGAIQLALYAEVEALLRRETLWFLRNTSFEAGLAPLVNRYAEGVETVRAALPRLLPATLQAAATAAAERFIAGGTPAPLAAAIAALPTLSFSTDIVLIGDRAHSSVAEAAEAFFGVLTLFDLGDIVQRGRDIMLADRFDRMALDRALANLMRALRDLSADVLTTPGASVADRLAAYRDARAAAVERTAKAVSDLTQGELTVSRLSVAAGMLADLARGT